MHLPLIKYNLISIIIIFTTHFHTAPNFVQLYSINYLVKQTEAQKQLLLLNNLFISFG